MIGRTRERAHLALVRELAECKCGMTQKDLLDAAGISSGGNGKRCSHQDPSGSISGAEFERIDIVDGVAYLGVSVYTNASLEVEKVGGGSGWGVATNGVIEVPAPGKQGFFYLMSKPSAPTDAPHAPIFIPEIIEE